MLIPACATKNNIEDTQLMSKRERAEVIEFMFAMHMCETLAINSATELLVLADEITKKEEYILLYTLKNNCISQYYLQKADLK